LACGQKSRYAEHDQSCREPRFFSHKQTIHARIGDVNRDLADQKLFCLGSLALRSALHFALKSALAIAPIGFSKVHYRTSRLSGFWAFGSC
jgi:hypothetical protein